MGGFFAWLLGIWFACKQAPTWLTAGDGVFLQSGSYQPTAGICRSLLASEGVNLIDGWIYCLVVGDLIRLQAGSYPLTVGDGVFLQSGSYQPTAGIVGACSQAKG